MITVIVTFKISDKFDAAILKENFIETSTIYQDVTGLRIKYYIADLENNTTEGFILLLVCKMLKISFMKIVLFGYLIDTQN